MSPTEVSCSSDQYYDGIIGKCHSCIEICRLDLEKLFCCNNCPDFCPLEISTGIRSQTQEDEYITKTTHIIPSTASASQELKTILVFILCITITAILSLCLLVFLFKIYMCYINRNRNIKSERNDGETISETRYPKIVMQKPTKSSQTDFRIQSLKSDLMNFFSNLNKEKSSSDFLILVDHVCDIPEGDVK